MLPLSCKYKSNDCVTRQLATCLIAMTFRGVNSQPAGFLEMISNANRPIPTTYYLRGKGLLQTDAQTLPMLFRSFFIRMFHQLFRNMCYG